jgi:hypothetical protein
VSKVSIQDLEKVIKYAKSQSAVNITVECAEHFDRVHFKVDAPSKGSSVMITVFGADSAKMPEILRSETLF